MKIPGLPKSVLGVLVAVLLALAAGCTHSALFPVANQHEADWKHAHGQYVIQAGGASHSKIDNGMTCNICHATASATESSKGSSQSCFSCHATGPSGNPHPVDWRTAHGAFVKAAGDYEKAALKEGVGTGKTCAQCHTTKMASDGTFPASPAATNSCFTCHFGPTP